MEAKSNEFLYVGRLVGTHGIRGEVRVFLVTDFPDLRFATGNKLFLLHPNVPEPLLLTVEKCRPHKKVLLIKFLEWNNINEAIPYVGGKLAVESTQVASVEEDDGEFYYHKIIGCDVITTEGKQLGRVKDILQLPANDVWIVQGKEKELLLPFIRDVVKEVDTENRRIIIQWMEGLG